MVNPTAAMSGPGEYMAGLLELGFRAEAHYIAPNAS